MYINKARDKWSGIVLEILQYASVSMRVIRARGYVYSDWHVDGDWHLLQIDNAMINHKKILVFKPLFLIFISSCRLFTTKHR